MKTLLNMLAATWVFGVALIGLLAYFDVLVK